MIEALFLIGYYMVSLIFYVLSHFMSMWSIEALGYLGKRRKQILKKVKKHCSLMEKITLSSISKHAQSHIFLVTLSYVYNLLTVFLAPIVSFVLALTAWLVGFESNWLASYVGFPLKWMLGYAVFFFIPDLLFNPEERQRYFKHTKRR